MSVRKSTEQSLADIARAGRETNEVLKDLAEAIRELADAVRKSETEARG